MDDETTEVPQPGTEVPEPVTWNLRTPIQHAGMTYEQVTLRAATVEQMMKATAVRGASNLEVACRLIETISGVPYEAVRKLPEWMLGQMTEYLEEFTGNPAPDPLARWRQARKAAAAALVAQDISNATDSPS
jgi:hypothetical protein